MKPDFDGCVFVLVLCRITDHKKHGHLAQIDIKIRGGRDNVLFHLRIFCICASVHLGPYRGFACVFGTHICINVSGLSIAFDVRS